MWVLFAILAAVFAAIVVVSTKAGLKNLDSSLAFAVQAIFIVVITWSVVFFQGTARELAGIDKNVWIFLTVAGICTTLSTLFSYYALTLGPASYVTAIERLSLVFAVVFSILFLKEKISWQIVLGVGLMISGALIIALQSKSS